MANWLVRYSLGGNPITATPADEPTARGVFSDVIDRIVGIGQGRAELIRDGAVIDRWEPCPRCGGKGVIQNRAWIAFWNGEATAAVAGGRIVPGTEARVSAHTDEHGPELLRCQSCGGTGNALPVGKAEVAR